MSPLPVHARRIIPCIAAAILATSCAEKVTEPTVVVPPAFDAPRIIGDGMEIRCYRIVVGMNEVHRAMIGMDAVPCSGNEQVLRGIEYYTLPVDRINDLVSVIGDGAAWNVRWVGQTFAWRNMLPAKVPIDDSLENGWIAMPGRTWSTMMEDGPVVYMECVPIIRYENVVPSDEREWSLLRDEDLRAEHLLRPGECLLLLGGDGIPLADAMDAAMDPEQPDREPTNTLGSMLTRTMDPTRVNSGGQIARRDILVFIPHFTSQRLRPLAGEPAPVSR